MGDNPLQLPPLAVADRGLGAIRAYFKDLDAGTAPAASPFGAAPAAAAFGVPAAAATPFGAPAAAASPFGAAPAADGMFGAGEPTAGGLFGAAPEGTIIDVIEAEIPASSPKVTFDIPPGAKRFCITFYGEGE